MSENYGYIYTIAIFSTLDDIQELHVSNVYKFLHKAQDSMKDYYNKNFHEVYDYEKCEDSDIIMSLFNRATKKHFNRNILLKCYLDKVIIDSSVESYYTYAITSLNENDIVDIFRPAVTLHKTENEFMESINSYCNCIFSFMYNYDKCSDYKKIIEHLEEIKRIHNKSKILKINIKVVDII